jgi:hypothetical protein
VRYRPEGNPIQPYRVHSVREASDDAFLSDLPTYEELLPLFIDHPLADEEGIRTLKNHDRRLPILASRYDGKEYLVLFGADIVRRQKKSGKCHVPGVVLPVGSYSELQFVIAAVAKFVGVPSTDGKAWQDT